MNDRIGMAEAVGTTDSVYSSIRAKRPILAGVRYRAIVRTCSDNVICGTAAFLRCDPAGSYDTGSRTPPPFGKATRHNALSEFDAFAFAQLANNDIFFLKLEAPRAQEGSR